MQIDWFTVTAQIINFLVLVYLLKRFLYAPIVNAMDQREKAIAQRMQDAEQKEHLAALEAQRYRESTDALEKNKAQLLSDARADLDLQKSQWLEQLRSDMQQTKTQWQEDILREQQEFLHALRHEMSRQTQHLLRRAFIDLANVQMEQQAVAIFLSKLKQLDHQEKQKLLQAFSHNKHECIIRSAFALTPQLQQQIKAGVQEEIIPALEIKFEQTSELICGMELVVPGRKIQWNMQAYLDDIEKEIEHMLETAQAEIQQ